MTGAETRLDREDQVMQPAIEPSELRAERARTKPADAAKWAQWNRPVEIRALAAMFADPEGRHVGGAFEDVEPAMFYNADTKTAITLLRNLDASGTPATLEALAERWKRENSGNFYDRGERLIAAIKGCEPERTLRGQAALATELQAAQRDLLQIMSEAEIAERDERARRAQADEKPGDKPSEPGRDDRGKPGPKRGAVGLAQEYVERLATHPDGPTLRRWRGDWYRWIPDLGRYVMASDERLEAGLYRDLGLTKPADVHDVRAALIAVDGVLIDELDLGSWIGAPLVGCSPLEIAACPNGLLELRSRTLHPPTPRHFAVTSLGVNYEPNASEPSQWLAFLRKLWPSDADSIAALQEWFGYMLTPNTRQQKIMMLVGPKRSGKGTIMRVLRALLGGDSVAAPTLASLGTNFGLQPLIGKTAAIIGDARLGGRTDIAQVVERLLSISGEDALTIDRKHRSQWTGQLSTRVTIVTNDLPRFSDASDALPGRLVILELTRSFYGEEDTGLTDKLIAELPGILLWAIEGWNRLHRRGHFVQPTASAELIDDLEDLASPVRAWVRQRCVKGAGEQVVCTAAYTDFKQWCQEQGHQHVATSTMFGRDLKAAAGASRMQVRDGLIRQGVYRGIRLRTLEERDDAI